MKTISLAVSEGDYEEFRRVARKTGKPIAQLIREAMAFYRAERMASRPRMTDLPVLVGHRLVAELPSREELYDEIFDP